MTVEQARERAKIVRARIVEVVYCKGEARVNVVLPSGLPRTWRCER
jgi:hypothetical protein